MSGFANFALNLIGSAISASSYNTGEYYNFESMGCAGSIFNSCGCDGVGMSEAAQKSMRNANLKTGLAVGALGIGALILGKVLSGDTKAGLKKELTEINKNINDTLADLGNGATIENYQEKIAANRKVIADVDTANTNFDKKEAELATLNTTIEKTCAGIKEQESIIKNADTVLANTNATDAERNEARQQKETATTEKTKLEAELAKQIEQKEATETALRELGQNLNGLYEQLKTMVGSTEQLDLIETQLTGLLTQLAEVEAKFLDKADGKEVTRSSENNFAKLFGENGDVNTGEKVSKRDIREAISQYRTATTDEEKAAAAQTLQKLWNAADSKVTENATLRTAYNIIANQADLG